MNSAKDGIDQSADLSAGLKEQPSESDKDDGKGGVVLQFKTVLEKQRCKFRSQESEYRGLGV
ncbi:MAG TPA: hypothetical protein VK106_02455 [Balneolaceae bacterium]|nr:hypothetical protein [Balneolaceae bacterium]